VAVVAVIAAGLVAAVAAAATALADGPVSTSSANEATNQAAPVTAANPPTFRTAVRSMRRD
jgi:hypothetical protein